MDLEGINESFSKHYAIANEVSQTFSEYVWDNPRKALDELFDWYNNALDKAYTDKKGNNVRGFIEAVAGGPHEAVPAALYNSVGAIYPILDREMKDVALRRVLGILDGINNLYVQLSHTPYIKEPLLLADIATVRGLYWPGLDEGKRRIDDEIMFADFQHKYLNNGYFKKGTVDSDFIVAYSLLRNDISDWGEPFAQAANPSFLERVLKGALTMRVSLDHNILGLTDEELGGADRDRLNKRARERMAEGKQRLKTLFPRSVHRRLDQLSENNDWPNIFDFTDHRSYHIERVVAHLLEDQ